MEKDLLKNENRIESALSETAREALDVFQQMKFVEDKEEKIRLIENFLSKIYLMVIEGVVGEPPLKHRRDAIKSIAQDIVENRTQIVPIRLELGSGSSGRRISFEKRNPDNRELAEQVRWMWYRKPHEDDWVSSHKYWENFMRNFGKDVVDLLQELK